MSPHAHTPAGRPAGRPRTRAVPLLLAVLPLAAGAEPAPAATDLDRIVVSGQRDGYSAEPTPAATGLALTRREIPQSISVLTRTQLDDFGLDNLNDALDLATGVNVERVENTRTYYTARGFDITNFQRDGLGIPLPYGVQNGDIDTAPYERIEVLRGANGLMSGTGNPSATVNFVRKRPTADFEAQMRATVGSWERVRLEADVAGPFDAEARVRGRAVAAWEDGASYLDRHRLEKAVAYGAIEADLGAGTRLLAGILHQRNDADGPLWGALPLYYSDGTPTDYDRSTSTAADWSFWDTRETRAFVELAHALAGGWELRAAVNHERLLEDTQLFYVYGTPDRATGLGLFSYPSDYEGEFDALQADLRLVGGFALGGRTHDVVAGLSRADGAMRETSWYGNDIGTPLPPLEQWAGRYPKPAFDAFSAGSDFDYRRDTVYATVRWNLGERFKLITGANRAHVRMDGESYGEPHDSDEARTTPFAGVVWDVAPAYSLYVSYGEIFAQQTETGADGRVLPAIEGDNAEAGIKAGWFDGRLHASAAVFRVHQDNLAESVGFDPALGRTVYVPSDAVSQGYELELAGELGEHVSLSAGFTHLAIEDDDGAATRTYVPRHTLRMAAMWRVPRIEGLRLGVSARWQDDIHREQSLLLADGSPVVTRQEAYTVVGLVAGYRFAGRWEATLNVDNLTDAKYVPSLYWEQGYYAAPRSASLTVAYRF